MQERNYYKEEITFTKLSGSTSVSLSGADLRFRQNLLNAAKKKLLTRKRPPQVIQNRLNLPLHEVRRKSSFLTTSATKRKKAELTNFSLHERSPSALNNETIHGTFSFGQPL